MTVGAARLRRSSTSAAVIGRITVRRPSLGRGAIGAGLSPSAFVAFSSASCCTRPYFAAAVHTLHLRTSNVKWFDVSAAQDGWNPHSQIPAS